MTLTIEIPNDKVAKAIEEVNSRTTGEKQFTFRSRPFPKGHLTHVETPTCQFLEYRNIVEVYIK